MNTKNPNPTFKFWYENKVTDERTYSMSDIIQLFHEWLKKKDRDWIEYYGTQQIVTFFIADKDGLNSVCDQKDVPELVERMKPIILDYVTK